MWRAWYLPIERCHLSILTGAAEPTGELAFASFNGRRRPALSEDTPSEDTQPQGLAASLNESKPAAYGSLCVREAESIGQFGGQAGNNSAKRMRLPGVGRLPPNLGDLCVGTFFVLREKAEDWSTARLNGLTSKELS